MRLYEIGGRAGLPHKLTIIVLNSFPCNVIIITPIELLCFLLKGNVALAKTIKTDMLIKHFQNKIDLAG